MLDSSLVGEFEGKDIELNVGLLGGKVHGSLARAGKFLVFEVRVVVIVVFVVDR